MSLSAQETNMLVASSVLALTFLGIFTERLHGIERAKFAMAGAGIIVIVGQWLGFYSPAQAVEAVDWNVVFLLGIMMILVSIMASTGGFRHLAHSLAVASGGSQFKLLVLLGSAVSLFSMLLDNVTTVIVFGPLIILICQTMKTNPTPYLIAAAMLATTGGVATLVGDPPNMMIGSAARVSFGTFVLHMLPLAAAAWVGISGTLAWLYRRELRGRSLIKVPSEGHFTNRALWHKSLLALGVIVVLFLLHPLLHWPSWLAAAAGLTLLLFMAGRLDLRDITTQMETPLLIFFIALFMLIGGVEQSGLLLVIGEALRPLVTEHPIVAALVLLWSAAMLSALIDNIPITSAMIPILLGLQHEAINVSVLWWALALGLGIGGTGSHIGSTANVYIVTLSERLAREEKSPGLLITPGLWLRRGLPATLMGLLLSSLVLVLGYDLLMRAP